MINSKFTRRDFARTIALGVAVAHAPAAQQDPWSQVPAILARIKPPVFPNRSFNITAFGAKGDGVVDCTEAFARAITACNQAGGGRVVVPAGKFLTGPIHLKSRVNLHVFDGRRRAF